MATLHTTSDTCAKSTRHLKPFSTD